MQLRDLLKQTIEKILRDKGVADISVKIDIPDSVAHGDYATPVAFSAAKVLRKQPMLVAEEIVNTIANDPQLVGLLDKAEAVKPGFINITVKRERLIALIVQLIDDRKKIESAVKNKTAIIEYSSPNIAKPFTVGHLRSTIIGDAVANLLEAKGWKIYRDNHVGDWGTQFGKQIYAIKEWGNQEEIARSENPVKLLVALYVRFHEEAEKEPSLEEKARAWFKKLEDGDPEARELWEKCVTWSWKEFAKLYQLLGVQFTENGGLGYGESFFEDKMKSVVTQLKQKNFLQESQGAQVVFFPEDKYPPLLILKRDGATLYSTRDLATDKFRKEHYGAGITIINEVGTEQSLYFQQLFLLEEMLGWYKPGQRIHIKHGHYRFKDQKMSTRKGNVIWLEDVLNEAITRAKSLLKAEASSKAAEKHSVSETELSETAKIIGIGALKWNDLKRSSEQDIVFDWEDILNMQGNSGPYLQYTVVRINSIFAKAGNLGRDTGRAEIGNLKSEIRNRDNLELQSEEDALLHRLIHYDEVMEAAAETFSPNILCSYLFSLAQEYNLFYQKLPILKANSEEKAFRLALSAAVAAVITQGLTVLGIQVPEKM